jgi:hypothetical protein
MSFVVCIFPDGLACAQVDKKHHTMMQRIVTCDKQ